MYGNKNNKVKSRNMKKFTLFIAMVLTALFGVKTTVSAQDYETEEQIEWIKYAVDFETAKTNQSTTDGIYLCHWDGNNTYKFVNAGGEYGTQAVATSRAMKMTLGGTPDACTFSGTLYNKDLGTYLGQESDSKVFLDRKDTEGTWKLEPVTSISTGTCYKIATTKSEYLNVDESLNTLVTNGTSNGYWLLVPRTAFREVLLAVTHQTNIEVSGLFLNTLFVRYMNENTSWEWWTLNGTQPGEKQNEDTQNPETGAGLGIAAKGAYRSMAPGAEKIKPGRSSVSSTFDYAETYGAFSSAEIKEPMIMRQTASKVKVGTYIITAQAFLSNHDGETLPAQTAYLFASGATGQNEGALIPTLESTEQQNFTDNFYNNHQNLVKTYLDTDIKYFRGNVAAGEFLATNNGKIPTETAIYNPNTDFHNISIAVTVTPNSAYGTGDDGKTQYGDLTIGIVKYSEEGTVYARNIRVYYSGEYEFGIDSYSTDNTPFSATFSADGKLDEKNSNIDGIDEYQYGYARQFNLVRDFGDLNTTGDKIANPKWEALVLPVNLTATQVRNAFGDDVKLSELVGLANNGTQIRFKPVDLSNPNSTAIYAGGCYVIKVTKAPEIGREEEYQFNLYNSIFGETHQVQMNYYGPVYQIDGVTRESTLTDLITNNNGPESYSDGIVTKTYTNEGKDLNFTGYFYWNQTTPTTNAYVVSRGKMFYLETPWKNLTGTMWKLEDPTLNPGEAKDISIDFGDGDITNSISDITADGENTNVTGVYNLNGQKVSDGTTTDNLPKGIYIVNGKKHVVR